MKCRLSSLQVTLSSILIFRATISTTHPLNPEDVESLLPGIPRDTNDTLAAVVEDPVVKDAVNFAASNGSLNGLVVKKRVLIMSASDPEKVLSEREQTLVVPTEHLEDVRRNITEAKQMDSKSEEFDSVENHSLFEGTADEYTTKKSESRSLYQNDLGFSSEDDSRNSVSSAEDFKTEFLEDRLLQEAALPEDRSKKVSVPIIAVIDPSNFNDGKIESPIAAVLQNQVRNDALKNQVDFLKDNRQKIEKETQAYIDRAPLSIDPESWKSISSEIAAPSSLNYETRPTASLQNLETPYIVAEELLLTPVIIPPLDIVSPLLQTTKNAVYPRDVDDMDVAEDIIFRPLFRYRQEAQQRLKYREENNNRRRYNNRRNNPYRTYDTYPRRDYRYKSRYDDDYQ